MCAHVYPSVCMRIFLKIWTKIPGKYMNHNVNECELVASEVNRLGFVELLFVDVCIWCAHHLKPFPRLNCRASSAWSKQFFKLMNIDFAFKAFRKFAIFKYGGFEFDAVGGTKLTKRRKNARN